MLVFRSNTLIQLHHKTRQNNYNNIFVVPTGNVRKRKQHTDVSMLYEYQFVSSARLMATESGLDQGI